MLGSVASAVRDLCWPGGRSNLSPDFKLGVHQSLSLGCTVPASMPAAEMLKMQPARVEHSILICGLFLGNKNTKKLVNQGRSQSPQVVCLFLWSITWLVIGGKFFTIARPLVLLRPHTRLQLHFGQMKACCSPSPGLCQLEGPSGCVGT